MARRMLDSQGRRLAVRRAQRSGYCARQPAGHRFNRWAPSIQKCASYLPTGRVSSGQDGANTQKGTECPGEGSRVTMKVPSIQKRDE